MEAEAPLALTMGEPAGIGGELTLKAWLRRDEAPAFFVIDDPERLERLTRNLDLPVNIAVIDAPHQASAAFASALPVLARRLATECVPGTPDLANAPAVRASIEDAVALAMSGQTAAVVTNPVHKETLYESGFPFPGHTEFLADLGGLETPPVMMLVSAALRTVPVTVHASLTDAVKSLSAERIIAAATIADSALRTDFAIATPRLAVAGLNPHAGEGGTLGTEEAEVIGPAIAALRANGIEAFGPVPPDALFSARARSGYDAAICMYHDQALIPVKTLDFDGAVNVTLGLPFVRTSPDHGTALDIAGTGSADASSLLAALGVAADMARRRARAGA